jgi:hypothetical protein
MATICFNRIRFVSNDHSPAFASRKVLEDATLVAILVVKRVRLNFTNGDVRKAPDLRIGIQPPITTVLLTGSSCNIQFNPTQVSFVESS